MKRIVLLTLACAAAGSMFGIDIYIWPLDLVAKDRRPAYYVLKRRGVVANYKDDSKPEERIPLELPSPQTFNKDFGDDVCKNYSLSFTQNEIVIPEGLDLWGLQVVYYNASGEKLKIDDLGYKNQSIYVFMTKTRSGINDVFTWVTADENSVNEKLDKFFETYYSDLGQKCLGDIGKNKAQILAIRAKWKLSEATEKLRGTAKEQFAKLKERLKK